jgi:hypothetical protein
MKPDWDKLMEEFKDHKSILVGDVDCTADDGKDICSTAGVKGYPTIKHGDVSNLQDYQGGRDFDALQTFAKGLKPLCSPSNMDLCDEDDKKKIEEVMAMDNADIEAKITEGDKAAADAEKLFNDEVQKLQNAYQKLQTDKEETLAEIAKQGVGMYKSVLAHKKKTADAEVPEEKEEL